MGMKYHPIASLLEFNGLLHSSIQFPAHRNKDNQLIQVISQHYLSRLLGL